MVTRSSSSAIGRSGRRGARGPASRPSRSFGRAGRRGRGREARPQPADRRRAAPARRPQASEADRRRSGTTIPRRRPVCSRPSPRRRGRGSPEGVRGLWLPGSPADRSAGLVSGSRAERGRSGRRRGPRRARAKVKVSRGSPCPAAAVVRQAIPSIPEATTSASGSTSTRTGGSSSARPRERPSSKGQRVVVEGDQGLEYAAGHDAPPDDREAVPAARGPAAGPGRRTTSDLATYQAKVDRETRFFADTRELASEKRLPLKLVRAEESFDARKYTVYYTSETRIDYRQARRGPRGEVPDPHRDAAGRAPRRDQDAGRPRARAA